MVQVFYLIVYFQKIKLYIYIIDNFKYYHEQRQNHPYIKYIIDKIIEKNKIYIINSNELIEKEIFFDGINLKII